MTYSIDAFHCFIVSSWCCYIGYNSDGELRKVFGVGFLDSLTALLVADCGSDVVAAREESIQNMSCDES